MKKTLLILFLLLIPSQAILASNEDKKDAIREMNESYKKHYNVCKAIDDNFRYDHQFAGYFRGKCLFYQSDRQRLMTSIFPVTSNSNNNYKEELPLEMAKFAVDINKKELENYKTIVTEYCKYNAYKFEKKNPQACTSAKIKSIFD